MLTVSEGVLVSGDESGEIKVLKDNFGSHVFHIFNCHTADLGH